MVGVNRSIWVSDSKLTYIGHRQSIRTAWYLFQKYKFANPVTTTCVAPKSMKPDPNPEPGNRVFNDQKLKNFQLNILKQNWHETHRGSDDQGYNSRTAQHGENDTYGT
jgi:hypothetical protein